MTNILYTLPVDLPAKRVILDNPQNGIRDEYIRVYVPSTARDYIRELAAVQGISEGRALGLIILEHQALTRV